MTGSELSVPISQKKITEKFLQALMATPTIPTRYRESPTGFLDMVAAIKYGEELGVGPFTSLYMVYLVNGQGSLQGQLMLALMWKAGHKVTVDIDELGSTVHCFRNMDGEMVEVGEVTFTVEDAKQAELLDKGTYEKYLKHMLTWRAVGLAARLYYPDVMMGIGYHPSELGVDVLEELPEFVEVTGDIEDEQAEIRVVNILEAEVVDIQGETE